MTINAKELFGEKKSYLKQRQKMKKSIIALIRAQRAEARSACLSRHNTILAYAFNGRVSHVVDTGKERSLIMIHELDEHLSVPRYEHSVAQRWLNNGKLELSRSEDDEEIIGCYAKVILTERELREIVKRDKMLHLENVNSILSFYKEA